MCAITQDDSHVFCTNDPSRGYIFGAYRECAGFIQLLGMKLSLRLSFRDDTDSYLGSREMWSSAEGAIHKTC